MKTRGMRTFGALFLVLLFLMGAWATRPGWSAQAQQGKPIQGEVSQLGNVTVIPDATVTLTNVHSLANTTEYTGRGTNSKLYKFTDAEPGYYSMKVTAPGYFDNNTGPFRYDGNTLIQMDFKMVKWPERNESVDVLVTETSLASHNETLFFPRTGVQKEETIATFTANHVVLSHTPIVSIQPPEFYNSNPGDPVSRTLLPAEYQLTDQWSGWVQINNATIAAALAARGPPYSLKITYTYTATTTHLNHTPVAEAPYMVFKNGGVWPTSSGDWTLDINLGTLTINQNLVWGSDSVSMAWNSTEEIAGAKVTLYDPVHKQVIDSANSNTKGWANFSAWVDNWEIWASKKDYETVVKPVAVADSMTARVQMPFGIYIDGAASDTVKGYLFDENPVAFLYNIDPLTPPAKKVITAEVNKATFTFKAYRGSFLLIVDADWHKASVSRVDVLNSNGMGLGPINLDVSPEERVSTVMAYQSANWSLVNIYQNFTLNRDSKIPGLEIPQIRDAFLQIDYTLGNKDGTLDSNEVVMFGQWLQKNGPKFINTDGLLTTNGKTYLSNKIADSTSADTEYVVTPNIDQLRSQPIWINTTTHYTVSNSAWIAYNKSQYYVNFTGAWDTNTTVYHNNTYVIDLPKRYEMTETTSRSQGLEIENFTRIELDPKTGIGSPKADMIVRLSANGTARVRVKGPAGHFQELNTTLENYTAVVMAKFNITYSADQSSDPVGKIADANFTWDFGEGFKRYGMDVEYNYTVGMRHDNCLLTVREAGGNITTRPFHIIVDSLSPVAKIWTNRSAGDSTKDANGTTLRVNESMLFRLDATRSTDKTYSTYTGTVAEAHWDFNGDGIEDNVPSPGKITNYSYEKPGTYTLKMWVIDSVGHRSVNATMTLIVNDTSPPNPDFVIYDSPTSNTPVTTLTEGVQYIFNASRTTDNYDSLANLTFSWDFGDGNYLNNTQGLAGYNVTHTYAIFNTSYKIKLNVTDKGFDQKTPNYKVLIKDQTVQADVKKRPSISVKIGSFSADPSNPEEGQDVTVTITITNDKNHGRASNVGVKLSVRSGATYNQVDIGPKFYNNSIEVNNSLEPGQDKQVKFTWKADTMGNRVLKVTITDQEEPYTWASDNSIEGTVNVKEAGWKMPLIIFGFIFVIFGIPILWYVIKKFRAGEWSLPRRGKAEEGEAPEKEETKEKKRL